MGGSNIEIGSNVTIQYKSWIAAVPLTGENSCKLEIGDGCQIGHFNEIFATKNIYIGKNVLLADRVYISDNSHGHRNPLIPIIKQPITQLKSVRIEEGSWLGAGACIIGACVGRNCVIGANSVVTHDIPDYSVAVGAPAKVIKRYDFERKEWRKTNSHGDFLNNEYNDAQTDHDTAIKPNQNTISQF